MPPPQSPAPAEAAGTHTAQILLPRARGWGEFVLGGEGAEAPASSSEPWKRILQP